MTPSGVLAALAALGVAVVAGTVAHEVSHAAVLRAFGGTCRFRFLPGRRDGVFHALAVGSWASVTPVRLPPGVPTWGLRAAALAPLWMLVPAVAWAAALGWSTPTDPAAALAMGGWLACALPSPADFAICFRPAAARRAMREGDGWNR